MTTQTLRGMAQPRARCTGAATAPAATTRAAIALDETQAFVKFNVAFDGLLGRGGPIPAADMQAFTDFILEVTYPPNPIRALDNSLTADEQAGRDVLPELGRRRTSSSPATAATRSTRRRASSAATASRASSSSRSSSRSRTCATCTRRSACSACRRSPFFNAGRQRPQGRPGPRLRLPARRQHRHRLPLPQHHGVQPDQPGRLPDPQSGRLPERRRRRSGCGARSRPSCWRSTATWRRSSASRRR